MGSGSRWFAAALGLAVAAAIGVFTYNLGFAHGIAQAPAVSAPGAVPYLFYPRPWGWGFGFFPFFGLIWIFLLLAFARRVWWGPRWYGRGYGRCGYGDRVPPQFDEWHRRAHARQDAPEPAKP